MIYALLILTNIFFLIILFLFVQVIDAMHQQKNELMVDFENLNREFASLKEQIVSADTADNLVASTNTTIDLPILNILGIATVIALVFLLKKNAQDVTDLGSQIQNISKEVNTIRPRIDELTKATIDYSTDLSIKDIQFTSKLLHKEIIPIINNNLIKMETNVHKHFEDYINETANRLASYIEKQDNVLSEKIIETLKSEKGVEVIRKASNSISDFI